MVTAGKHSLRSKMMTVITGARAKDAEHRDATTSLGLPSGWWIVPAVVGGCAVWYQIIMALVG